ncbi:UPF0223 family protein [Enterococcus xiangfangensis]|uniref:UPF0223 family protein n=1 Tax=Enterococcus xiangfangensis TaxID=1296537 RepID=A0ABU3FC14_9ENTE|nr:UPF0223 family protein [Enterococcus xiangfangensis]MBM7711689.1 uncharacterized protein YktA (UPF0223 family) [Enterococcus xiangfangensis]MDT2760204.1 UPF0223 family protein [Enterococcus xiangfangensis]NBK07570.1 UPF0223 family protein [Enterococcus asini]
MANYSYPIDEDWTHEELALVIDFFNLVEEANETGVEKVAFLAGYKKFKTVVKSIGEEKKLGRQFQEVSGYSIYRTLQQAKGATGKRFKM